MAYRSLLIALILPLSGCLSISTIYVDGKRGPTYIGPGISIERQPSDAVGVKQVCIGLCRTCQTIGLGVISSGCIIAKPGTDIAILEGHTPRFVQLNTRNRPYESETPIRSFGADH